MYTNSFSAFRFSSSDQHNGGQSFLLSDLHIRFRRFLSSWISGGFISSSLNPEMKRERVATNFQRSGSTVKSGRNVKCTHKKENRSVKTRNKQHILKIDLRKIEQNLQLSPKDKNELKLVLDRIKYNDESKDPFNRMRREEVGKCKLINRTSIKTLTLNDNKKINKGSLRYRSGRNKYKYQSKTHLDCTKCEICSKSSVKLELEHKTKCINSSNMLTKSQEIIKQPVTHQSGKSCDILNRPLLPASDCRSTLRTVLVAKPSINIRNLRLRYINPTCYVQYSTNGNKDYSNATLKAHLGEGQCPDVYDPHPQHCSKRNPPNHCLDEKYVIAKGTLTAEDLEKSFKKVREIRKSLFPEESYSHSSSREEQVETKNVGPHRKKSSPPTRLKDFKLVKTPSEEVVEKDSQIGSLLESPEDPSLNRKYWDVESFPSTLHKLEKSIPTLSVAGERTKRELYFKTSKLHKLKLYLIKTCFCHCLEDSSDQIYEEAHPMSSKKKKYVKSMKIDRSRLKRNVNIIRTTEKEFLDEYRNKT